MHGAWGSCGWRRGPARASVAALANCVQRTRPCGPLPWSALMANMWSDPFFLHCGCMVQWMVQQQRCCRCPCHAVARLRPIQPRREHWQGPSSRRNRARAYLSNQGPNLRICSTASRMLGVAWGLLAGAGAVPKSGPVRGRACRRCLLQNRAADGWRGAPEGPDVYVEEVGLCGVQGHIGGLEQQLGKHLRGRVEWSDVKAA